MSLSASIVIDTYNYGRFIDRAITSAINQDLDASRREIIVVDDGSTDDTVTRVARYGEQVRYLYQPNGGQAAALNTGVRAARGAVVCFLDADDYYYPSRVSTVVDIFERRRDVSVVFNRYDIVDQNDKVLARALPKRVYEGDLSGQLLLGFVNGSPTSGISARRDLLLRTKIPESVFRISADYFYLNILPLQTLVATTPESLHAYYSHTENYYLTRSREVQEDIHTAQRAAIWEYAETNLHQRFVRGVHSYSYLGAKQGMGVRAQALFADVKALAAARASLRLNTWTIIKLFANFLLPLSMYTRLRGIRDRSWVRA